MISIYVIIIRTQIQRTSHRTVQHLSLTIPKLVGKSHLHIYHQISGPEPYALYVFRYEAPARTSPSVWKKDTMVTVCVRNHTDQVHIEAIREKEEKRQKLLPCNTKADTTKQTNHIPNQTTTSQDQDSVQDTLSRRYAS